MRWQFIVLVFKPQMNEVCEIGQIFWQIFINMVKRSYPISTVFAILYKICLSKGIPFNT